jgi:hypothetical protein
MRVGEKNRGIRNIKEEGVNKERKKETKLVRKKQ